MNKIVSIMAVQGTTIMSCNSQRNEKALETLRTYMLIFLFTVLFIHARYVWNEHLNRNCDLLETSILLKVKV